MPARLRAWPRMVICSAVSRPAELGEEAVLGVVLEAERDVLG